MTTTNLESYVDGIKVVSSTHTTVTLENGVTLAKHHCKFVRVDLAGGATYYRCTE